MEKLKNYLFYGTLNKREWLLIRDAIWENDNRFVLLMVSFSMFVLMTVLAVFTITVDNPYKSNAVAYGIVAIVELLLYVVARSATKFSSAILPLLTFVFNFIMFAFGVALGSFLDPGSYALALVVMIIVLPMLFCVRPIHSITSVLFVDAVFLPISYMVKEPDIFTADVLNVVVWSIVGFFLNAITTTARVNRFYEFYKNEESQKEISESFKQVATQMSMFKSLGNIYSSLYYIDLKTDSYVELASLPEARTFLGNSGGDAVLRMRSYCESLVADSFREQLLEFSDLQTADERLKKQNLISMQFLANVEGPVRKMEWFEINLIVVNRDENSDASSVLFAVRRIHEEKLKEINQMNRLQSALVAAETANKSKTIFLNNMSHDIRTPMNAITGFTGLAQKHMDDRVQLADYLNKISVANKHLLSLMNDVLDMSRIESGRVSLSLKPESVSSIVKEIRTIMQDDIFSRHQIFNVKMEGIIHDLVLCDRLRFKQVVLNLLSNASKFTPDGGRVDLEIAQEASAKSGFTTLKILVRDTGIGMSEKFLRRVFEPFERENVAGDVQGTGLGMAIAKNLTDLMGGFIYVKSSRNEGTEVLLDVSFEIYSETISGTGDDQAGRSVIAPNQFAGRRILLVEDNRMNQMMTVRLLKDSGVEILIAENGQVGCDMLEKYGPEYFSLVLMDIQMPVMNGFEATRKIRNMKEGAFAKVPVVAMTADAFEESRREAVAAGMNDFISKPVEADTLNATLLKFLG
ncbi:MAG: response regulator [Fibrobacter sp.]|nr:response regulator [Fibrobacter sp.]